MKNLTFILLTSLFLFGCTEVNDNKNLLSEIDRLKMENDSLTKQLGEEKPELNNWNDAEYDGRSLIESGIENPATFIEDKLREKTNLIPLNPVLGGSMQFINIQLLSSEWIIADFEDGHVQGRAIYKYKLIDNDQMEFELLDFMANQ